MIDWVAVAAAFEAPLEPRDRASVIEPLEKLENQFRPLRDAVEFGAPLWNGPGGSE